MSEREREDPREGGRRKGGREEGGGRDSAKHIQQYMSIMYTDTQRLSLLYTRQYLTLVGLFQ